MSGPSSTVELLELDLIRVAATQHLSRHALVGLQRPEVATYISAVTDDLVAALQAYVLGEDAGERCERTVRCMIPVRPWWIPRWAWKRIPAWMAEWNLVAEPKYTYPSANIKVPHLGQPVRFPVIAHHSVVGAESWVRT